MQLRLYQSPVESKKKKHVNSENTPYINQGKGDLLAPRAGMGSVNSPIHTQEDFKEIGLSTLNNSLCCYCEYVCQPDMGHTLLMAGNRNGQSAAEVDPKCFAEPSWGEINNTILEHTSRMWHGTFPVQLCNSLLLKKFSTQTSALAPELTLVGHHTLDCAGWSGTLGPDETSNFGL
eukprot:1140957-Pelagomonas_calceolata.AAC.2